MKKTGSRNRTTSKQKSQNDRHQGSFLQQNSTYFSHLNSRFPSTSNHQLYERKCQTPSISLMSHKKSKSKTKERQREFSLNVNHKSNKSRDRLSDKKKNKTNYYSIKNMKQEAIDESLKYNSNSSNPGLNTIGHNSILTQKSPFKHKNNKQGITINNSKNRNIANLSNLRHVKNIESQLANLSTDSIHGHQRNNNSVHGAQFSYHDNFQIQRQSSTKRNKKNTIVLVEKQHPIITEGKNLMKKYQFEESISIFQEGFRKKELKNNTELQYLVGVCHFHLGNYDEVIKNLSEVLAKQENYRKNVYLFLAIAYKKENKIDQAIFILSKGLNLYPKYLDILLLRAKIFARQKRYYESIEDLNSCIKIQPNNIQSYISKADCLRNLSQYKQAIKIYSEVLSIKFDSEIMLKRAITYIESEQLKLALNDLATIITQEPKNSEAYLFKGLAFSKCKNFNEALLSYEQSIKFNTSKKATTKALYQIAKLKIQMGDFYGASYTLERANSLDIDMKVIDKLKTFTDGATFIMKKKYRRGIQLLNMLAKKQHLNEQIRNYLFSFRSYGHFCLNKFPSALSDLKQLIKCGFMLDQASIYNMTVLQGIIASQNYDFSEAMLKFNKACNLRPQFGDPQMYKALCLINEYNRTPKLRSKNQHYLKEALNYILASIEKQPNYNYYYICSVVLYTLKDYEEALKYLEEAIEKSDDHVMKHFYLKALIKAMQDNFQETFTCLNNVLSILKDQREKEKEQSRHSALEGYEGDDLYPAPEKEILEVYLHRAKCYLLYGDKKKAFQDLQTYISQKPLDNQIHTIAGGLLFSIGACQDAVKAFNYSPNVDKNKQILLSRMKCYLVLKELNLCLKDMQKLMQMDDKFIIFDFCCLTALKQASKGQEHSFREALEKISLTQELQPKKGHVFSLSDKFFFEGVCLFMLGQYDKAKKFMLKSKNLKKLNNQLEILPSMDQVDEEEYLQFFDNRIFTDKQIDYNIALCELMAGNEQKAVETLGQYQAFGKLHNQSVSECSVDGDFVDMTPFPTANRLCSIFPQTQYSENKKFRLSFCLPTVHPPNIKFQIQFKIIEQVTMSSIESRPDAPWIKRNKHGVVFTDQLLGMDVDIRTQHQNEKTTRKIQDIPQPQPANMQSIRYTNRDSHFSHHDDSFEQEKHDNLHREYLHAQMQLDKLEKQYNQSLNPLDFEEIQKGRKHRHEKDAYGEEQQQVSFETAKMKLKEMFALDLGVEEKLQKMLKKQQQQ